MSYGSSVIPNMKSPTKIIPISGSIRRERVSAGGSKLVVRPSLDVRDQLFAVSPGDLVPPIIEPDPQDAVLRPSIVLGNSGQPSCSEGKSEDERIESDATNMMWQRPSKTGKLGIPSDFPR